jgi:uncharacterized membrane protein
MQILPVKLKLRSDKQEEEQPSSDASFGVRAVSALGISIIADGLDYVGAPIFALPIVGDIADLAVAGLLYRITKSKVNVAINAIEFIPFIGDFIPTYTISTLLWILNESRKRRAQPRKEPVVQDEGIQTRIMRAYAVLRSKAA